VVLHELQREAVELEHCDLDVGALVPSDRVEPFAGHVVRAGQHGEPADVAIERDGRGQVRHTQTHVVEADGSGISGHENMF